MLYSGAAATAFIASIYLLLRKGNAFADGITPPMRLRRWAAALFAGMFLGHVLIIVVMVLIMIYGFSGDDIVLSYLTQVAELIFFGLLLWRVETLPQLESNPIEQQEQTEPQLQHLQPRFQATHGAIGDGLDAQCSRLGGGPTFKICKK